MSVVGETKAYNKEVGYCSYLGFGPVQVLILDCEHEEVLLLLEGEVAVAVAVEIGHLLTDESDHR